MTELITYVFEFITFIISIILFLVLLKQKKHSEIPLGDSFLAFGALTLGIYALSTIIYSFMGQEFLIILLLKLGMVSVMLSVLLLFFTMQILIHSTKEMRKRKFVFIVPFTIYLAISLLLIFTNYIVVIDAKTADTHFQPVQFALFAIFMISMLGYSAFSIYYFGISKSEGVTKKRMWFFFVGLLLFIGALINDAIGNIIEMEVLFDTLLFILLSLGILFVARAFYGKKSIK